MLDRARQADLVQAAARDPGEPDQMARDLASKLCGRPSGRAHEVTGGAEACRT
jgi:hypothetical protein